MLKNGHKPLKSPPTESSYFLTNSGTNLGLNWDSFKNDVPYNFKMGVYCYVALYHLILKQVMLCISYDNFEFSYEAYENVCFKL